MSKVQVVFDYIAKVSIGLSAAAGVLETATDVPSELHAVAAGLLVVANAVNAAISAATDDDIDGPLPGAAK